MSTGGRYADLGFPTAVRNAFFHRLAIAEAGVWAPRLAMDFPSNSEQETYKWLGSVPVMREWLGGRLEKELLESQYTLINAMYEATLPFNLMDIRRDKWNQILLRVRDLAVRTATHWDSLLSTLLMANGTCYDGQAYFSATHSEGSSGTLKNLLTSTEVPSLEIVSATAPTPAEMASAILGVIAYMYGWKDDQGEPINQNASVFEVMVPVAFLESTLIALTQQYLGASTSNPIVALKDKFTISALPNPRLTWTDSFAVFRTDGVMKPLIMQNELPVTTDQLTAGSDEQFKQNRWLFGVKASRTVGYGLWQHAAKATFATA